MKNKTCQKCKETLPISEFSKDKNRIGGFQCYCKLCCKDINSKYSSRYKMKQSEYQKKFYSNPINKKRTNTKQRELWMSDRIKCLTHYGGICACCGEGKYEFLAIDHINGGGNKHRKIIGHNFVRWLKKNNYPEGFRVLCHNCNNSLGHYGYCPHKHE